VFSNSAGCQLSVSPPRETVEVFETEPARPLVEGAVRAFSQSGESNGSCRTTMCCSVVDENVADRAALFGRIEL